VANCEFEKFGEFEIGEMCVGEIGIDQLGIKEMRFGELPSPETTKSFNCVSIASYKDISPLKSLKEFRI